MNIDRLDHATVKVLHTVTSNFAGAGFLLFVLLGLIGGDPQAVGTQIVGSVFMLSLFVAIGTSLQLWKLDRSSRRNKAPQAQGSRSA